MRFCSACGWTSHPVDDADDDSSISSCICMGNYTGVCEGGTSAGCP